VQVIKLLAHCLIDSTRVTVALWMMILVATGLDVRAAGPTQLEAGPQSICVLDDSGVVCWGDNRRGQAQSLALVRPRDISVGYEHTCALDDSGVHCWGSNDQGQLEVPPLDQPVQVSVGGHHSCAEDATGLVCWGAMGNEPVLVPPNLDF